MRHLTRTNESCRIQIVLSHTGMSHVKYKNQSCHTCEWFMPRAWMSHVTHLNESHHTHWQQLWVGVCKASHVAHVKESCHTYDWVKSHTYMTHKTSHVTLLKWSWRTYETHDSLTPICDMPCAHVWWDSCVMGPLAQSALHELNDPMTHCNSMSHWVITHVRKACH